MKTLALNQMEQINGSSCGGALVGWGWSGAGLLLAEVAITATTGPIGLVAGLSYAVAWGSAAAASTSVAVNC